MNCVPQVFAFPAACSPEMGGLEAIYIASPDEVKITTNAAVGTATLSAVTSGAKPFYKWELAPNSSSLVSTAQVSSANNTRFWQHVLTAVLNNFRSTTAGANVLGRLTRLCVVVQPRSGQQLLVSAEKELNAAVSRGAEVTGLEINQGTQRTDASGRATLTAQLDSKLGTFSVNLPQSLINS